jgi:WD40 repeat protein
VARPTPPPQNPNVGNTLADLDPDRLPPHQKKEGQDWFAVFNPRVQRVLDVDLVHTLPHDSVVCCVRFSHDGKYVATGCNRSAQIFDVQTGVRVSYLQDDSVDKDGDLYIRSVCFSPDGRYLATGAEDKVIRVGGFICYASLLPMMTCGLCATGHALWLLNVLYSGPILAPRMQCPSAVIDIDVDYDLGMLWISG